MPTVTGPVLVTQDSHPFYSVADLTAANGYVEEEFFIAGTARQFAASSITAVAGRPEGVAPETVIQEAAYRTRMVVRRPADATLFNGVVVQEWYNTTGGFDQEYEWIPAHEYFMRSGTIWVGVSVQFVGINDLKNQMPERYSSLVWPGDMFSEDVFSQAAQALLAPTEIDPLAGVRPEHLVAGGHSQSGTAVINYYNNIHPFHRLFDGFMPRGVEGPINTAAVGDPVIRTQTESAVEGPNEQDPDSEFYRRWEVAGASHADWQQQQYREPLIERDRGGSATPYSCLREPFSRIRFQYALHAAYEAMRVWLETGTPPPSSPRFEAVGEVIQRDEHGNALGGIRLPDHAAATATNTGDNEGVGFCALYGSYEPFDDETLRSLYADHGMYVSEVRAATAEAVSSGFLLPEDAVRSVTAAFTADLGLPTAVERLSGDERTATAAAISAGVGDHADTVVIASERVYADALAGAPLAVHLEAPLLLSSRDALSSAAADEIRRLGATEAVLLGGEAALSSAVAGELEALGVTTSRVGGANRFATAAAIAEELPATDEVVIAEGGHSDPTRGWPDALSASALAARERRPILLVAQDALPPETAAALDSDFNVLMVGGPAAIGENVGAAIDLSAGSVRRIAGDTRYATSVAVVEEAVERGALPAVTWVASGGDFADGLVASAAAGAQGGVVLLIDGQDLGGSPAAADWLRASAAEIRIVRIAGGSAAVSAAVETQLQELVAAT